MVKINRGDIEFLFGAIGTAASVAYIAYTVTQTRKQATVGVKVVLAKDGTAVVGALVQLGYATAVTNEKGVASFGIDRGEYFLFVSAPGFAPIQETLAVVSNQIVTVQLE